MIFFSIRVTRHVLQRMPFLLKTCYYQNIFRLRSLGKNMICYSASSLNLLPACLYLKKMKKSKADVAKLERTWISLYTMRA